GGGVFVVGRIVVVAHLGERRLGEPQRVAREVVGLLLRARAAPRREGGRRRGEAARDSSAQAAGAAVVVVVVVVVVEAERACANRHERGRAWRRRRHSGRRAAAAGGRRQEGGRVTNAQCATRLSRFFACIFIATRSRTWRRGHAAERAHLHARVDLVHNCGALLVVGRDADGVSARARAARHVGAK